MATLIRVLVFNAGVVVMAVALVLFSAITLSDIATGKAAKSAFIPLPLAVCALAFTLWKVTRR